MQWNTTCGNTSSPEPRRGRRLSSRVETKSALFLPPPVNKKNLFPLCVTALSGIFIAAYVAWHVNYHYPIVGWDHKYFFTRLIDTHLHYRVNGFTIQWYTPSFGGGLPGYPHPLNAQFSLPQILTLFLEPWSAVLTSYFAYVLIGYTCAYIFLRRSLGFGWMPATLGAVLFSANGFYLQHLANGHFNFQAFPVLPLFLVALFDKRLSIPRAAALIALGGGLLIYSASTYPTVFIGLSLLITLPLAWLIRPEMFDWPRLGKLIIFGGLLALGLTLSKLYAVASFMRFFPREMQATFDIPLKLAPVGLFLQLFGVMGLAPIYTLTGQKVTAIRELLQIYTGAYAGLWELDLSLSPVVWILLPGGILTLGYLVLAKRLAVSPLKGRLLALALLAFAVYLALEFTFARGYIYPILRELPFLRALHVNPRFGSAFLFPIALFGAYTLQLWTRSLKESRALALFLPFHILALLSLGAYLLIPLDRLQQRTFDLRGLQEVYQKIEQGETFPIDHIDDINDQRTFDDRASNLLPYDTLFGYNQGTFQATIAIGPAREIRDGCFNMTNPAGLVYPEVNDSSPWERIPAGQQEQLEDFLARRQPDWEIPAAQKAANAVSLVSLAVMLFLFLPKALLPARPGAARR